MNSRDSTLERDGNGGLGEPRIKEEEEEIVLAFNDENLISSTHADTTTDSPLPLKDLALAWQINSKNDVFRSHSMTSHLDSYLGSVSVYRLQLHRLPHRAHSLSMTLEWNGFHISSRAVKNWCRYKMLTIC